ncbi:transcriptional regulator [Oceanibaculum indicum]|uniref:Hpt domain-containing protein n=1 Tax=Oceanibaculum indicum TaxID=526216 RepID=A0A420WBL7_9PROT|nr:transcriptional regulator [Oceanibaculum indicum]RKQ68397.1 Hpt domain-containing protein [Oceanibaculum indicum]
MAKAQIIPPSMDLRRRAVNSKKGFSINPQPDELKKIEKAVHQSSDKFIASVAAALRSLREALASAETDPARWEALMVEIRRHAFDIKGLGGTFDYPLLTEIARSLHAVAGRMGDANPKQMAIIRCHIDALYVVLAERIQGSGGKVEQELLEAFRLAIAKNW